MPEENDVTKWQKVDAFFFCFILELSQPRIYADLLRFQTRVNDPKDPVYIIILVKSIIPFFIHSFHVLILVYEQRNQRTICNIYDKNNQSILYEDGWRTSFRIFYLFFKT